MILLFVIIHLFNNLYIQIEPFNSGPNLFGFEEFKSESHITYSYSSQINTIPTDVNNYYDVFKHLTGEDIYVYTEDSTLNNLITSYVILDFMYRFKYAKNTQYINEINKNLKTEVDKYQNINSLVKKSVKNTENHYNNLYLTTLYYRDIVYLLIYLTIISILLNVIFIEFGFNYSDKRVWDYIYFYLY